MARPLVDGFTKCKDMDQIFLVFFSCDTQWISQEKNRKRGILFCLKKRPTNSQGKSTLGKVPCNYAEKNQSKD
jgi:hypothetical protein